MPLITYAYFGGPSTHGHALVDEGGPVYSFGPCIRRWDVLGRQTVP